MKKINLFLILFFLYFNLQSQSLLYPDLIKITNSDLDLIFDLVTSKGFEYNGTEKQKEYDNYIWHYQSNYAGNQASQWLNVIYDKKQNKVLGLLYGLEDYSTFSLIKKEIKKHCKLINSFNRSEASVFVYELQNFEIKITYRKITSMSSSYSIQFMDESLLIYDPSLDEK